MQRRQFGRLVLQAAAGLGLRSVSAPWLGGCGGDDARASTAMDGATPLQLDAGARASIDARVERQADAQRDLADAATQVMHEALLIGSGYGSAVTAMRLTQKGIPVTMLEMGQLWNKPGADGKVFCSAIQPDARAMWFRDHTRAVVSTFLGLSTDFAVPVDAGILAIKGNDDMQVFCGRGFGGGSLVNLAMYVTPVREVFQRVLPTVDADEMFAKFYPLAKDELHSNALWQDFHDSADCWQYSRVLWDASKKAGIDSFLLEGGYDFHYMQMEQANQVPRSALAQEAIYGNNYGKRSLDKSYLAEAMGTGLLSVHALHTVKDITAESDGSYTVSAVELDVMGNVVAQRDFHTRRLFLGAGSMGTSELLVRARDRGTLPNVNTQVGTGWGPNSDIFVARTNPVWLPTGSLQSTVPGAGFRTLDQDGKNVFSMHLALPTGFENYTSMNIVMTENPEAGAFRYDAASDAVLLEWQIEQNAGAVKSARFVFDKFNVANGTDYRTDLYGGRDIADNTTYHPVGGCPLGRATDDFGRLKGYSGLYVTDGSLIPVGIGANPSLTITALAERNIERVLAEDFGV